MSAGEHAAEDGPRSSGADRPGDGAASRGPGGRSTTWAPRQRRRVWLAALAGMVTFLAIVGLWNRQNADVRSDAAEEPGGLFRAATAEGTSLAAVGPLSGLAGPCTAWLLDIGAADSAAAYAATTGACAGAASPSAVLHDEPADGAAVSFHAFAPPTSAALPELVEVPVERVEWASVRGTDLAVLRLAGTYADLAARGIDPIPPVPAPTPGTEVLVAGVPVQGIPDDQRYLRGSRCQAGPRTDVLSGRLLWHDLQVADCAGILDGSQGSVVLTEAGQAVGTISTSTIGAGEGSACAPQRPCEVSQGGVEVVPDRSYAVPVAGLPECFPDGTFAVGGQCPLEDPRSVTVARAWPAAATPGDVVQLLVPATAADLVRTRFTSGEVGVLDCRTAQGWQPVRTPRRAVPMPAREGYAVICVGSAAQPTELVVEIDGTPPDPGSIELQQRPVQGGVRVQPVLDPPELSQFRWVSGPHGATDCAAAEGYVRFAGEPALIQAGDLPSTVCVIGIDAAGNESEPSAHEVS